MIKCDERRRLCVLNLPPQLAQRGRTTGLAEPAFSVRPPDGAMLQVLRTLIYYFENEFGNYGCWRSGFTGFCLVFQTTDERFRDCI